MERAAARRRGDYPGRRPQARGCRYLPGPLLLGCGRESGRSRLCQRNPDTAVVPGPSPDPRRRHQGRRLRGGHGDPGDAEQGGLRARRAPCCAGSCARGRPGWRSPTTACSGPSSVPTATSSGPPSPVPTPPLTSTMDTLAAAVREQWTREAYEAGLLPEPMPVRWASRPQELARPSAAREPPLRPAARTAEGRGSKAKGRRDAGPAGPVREPAVGAHRHHRRPWIGQDRDRDAAAPGRPRPPRAGVQPATGPWCRCR